MNRAHPRCHAFEARAMMLAVAGQVLAQMDHLVRGHIYPDKAADPPAAPPPAPPETTDCPASWR